ncbi:GNAT family N-acetyltransferase [Leptolyngbya sp. FACHB-261]|uniref:GNAT family N-acetyltransferase n=1 Tax=Leptolyngbya sp. FACHB-261 TaxID=2692806 RepID=UPI0016848FA9|nr:GNAT family N-acetyltransferase [Leptolyngbya sp. FACHB-261]MBD2099726.1 GNAT family N-acetyltransferase [Leptolyngbya sp. FACHB-261]
MQILTYHPQYETSIVELVLQVQREEFGLPITLADQPDLLDIPTVYQQGHGNFWLAVDANQVIGTIAAIDFGDHHLALRKMFVASPYRGQGIGVGQQLLATLCHWAVEHKIRAIYLGTVDAFKAAHRFYEKHGFRQVEKSDLPATFPMMQGDTRFYRLLVPEWRADGDLNAEITA